MKDGVDCKGVHGSYTLPRITAVGGKICVRYGGQLLHILREDRVDSSLHAMLEESYFHSLVDGKAFAFLESGRAEEEMVIIS